MENLCRHTWHGQLLMLTIPLMPSGKRKRLYKVLTVSSGRISHSFWSRRSPVSRPSSAQKMVNPPFLSPWMRVLESKKETLSLAGRTTEKDVLGTALKAPTILQHTLLSLSSLGRIDSHSVKSGMEKENVNY